jgi:glucose/arabinose dehydrogenase
MRITAPLFCACALGLTATALAACGPSAQDPRKQIGANPQLPGLHQYLLPPMHVVDNVGWGNATPKVASGLAITALATNLKNPRSVYVLPNGDILVAQSDGPKEPISRPKEIVMNWIETKAHSSVTAPNNILLLRQRPDGSVESHVFIDNLHSPFGMVLVGNNFYVADTDAVLRFPYSEGQTTITEPGVTLTELPGGPIDHHWTKSLTASPDGSKLYAGVGSNTNIT